MVLVNYSVSPDAGIDEIILTEENLIRARLSVKFESLSHMLFILKKAAHGDYLFDLRSRLARFGLTSKLMEPPERRGNSLTVSFVADVRKFMDFYDLSSWQQFLTQKDFKWGKLAHVGPQLGKNEIESELELGIVRLSRGSVIEADGTIRLAISNPVQLTQISEGYLAKILDGSIPREKLLRIQPPVEGEVVVSPFGGTLAHTSVRPNGYSIIVHEDQLLGVRHSSASHVMPHSAESLYLEFMGNGKSDVKLDSVRISLHRSEFHKRHSSQIPLFKIPTQSSNLELAVIHSEIPMENRPFLTALCSYDPNSPRDLRLVARTMRQLQQKRSTIYLSEFPRDELHTIIAYEALNRKVGSIVFSKLPNGGTGFSDTDFDNIISLQKMGVNVFWDYDGTLDNLTGKISKPWSFHRYAFMPENGRDSFDRGYSSNSIFATFGSSAIAEQDDVDNVRAALEGIYRFTGGEGYVVNGGGPKMMTAFSEIGHSLGLKVGAISLSIEGQEGVRDIDFIFPFAENDINSRQGNLVDISCGYLLFKGGVGTLYELGEVLTKAKLEHSRKPILVIGKESDMIPSITRELLKGIADGTIPPFVAENVYLLSHGSQVYGTLMQHYNLEPSPASGLLAHTTPNLGHARIPAVGLKLGHDFA